MNREPEVHITFPGGEVSWDWTDWLGLVAVIIGIGYLITIMAAIREGESPLKILSQTGKIISLIFHRKSN